MQRFLRLIVTLSGKPPRIFHNPQPPHISASFLHPWRSVPVIFHGSHSGPVFARHLIHFWRKARRFSLLQRCMEIMVKRINRQRTSFVWITANAVVFLSWEIASEKFMSGNFAMHTAIFPYSYVYSDTNDTSLGPGGDLRVYLEGLAMAENVQEYVASNPFGQPPITESSPHWQFYCEVKRSRAIQRYRKRKSK